MIGKSLRHNGAFGAIISRLSLLAPTAHRCFAAKISAGYNLYGGGGTRKHQEDKIKWLCGAWDSMDMGRKRPTESFRA